MLHVWTPSISPHEEDSEPVVQDSVPSPPLPAAESSGVLALPRALARWAMDLLLTEALRGLRRDNSPGDGCPAQPSSVHLIYPVRKNKPATNHKPLCSGTCSGRVIAQESLAEESTGSDEPAANGGVG